MGCHRSAPAFSPATAGRLGGGLAGWRLLRRSSLRRSPLRGIQRLVHTALPLAALDALLLHNSKHYTCQYWVRNDGKCRSCVPAAHMASLQHVQTQLANLYSITMDNRGSVTKDLAGCMAHWIKVLLLTILHVKGVCS